MRRCLPLALTCCLVAPAQAQTAADVGPPPLSGDECAAIVEAVSAHFAKWDHRGPYKIFDVMVPSGWIIDRADWTPDAGIRPPEDGPLRDLTPCTAEFARKDLSKPFRLRPTPESALKPGSGQLRRLSYWLSTPYFDQGGARLTIAVGHNGDFELAEAVRQPDGRWLGRATGEGYGVID